MIEMVMVVMMTEIVLAAMMMAVSLSLIDTLRINAMALPYDLKSDFQQLRVHPQPGAVGGRCVDHQLDLVLMRDKADDTAAARKIVDVAHRQDRLSLQRRNNFGDV